MHIIHWRPWAELEEAFENHIRGLDFGIDVYEDAGNVVVEMQAPGIKPDEVDIEVIDNVLHVRGAHAQEKEKSEKHFYRKEIRRGSFEKTVVLPSAVHAEQAKASFEHGMLRITIPLEKAKEAHKVKIEAH